MSAYVYFPAIEKQERVLATLSKKIIDGLPKEKLELNGLVITDYMEMNAVSETI